jgi:adenylosuccinate synthase
MANVIVVGAQWGDEGKGKVVDLLCHRVEVVARFQGGPNAGHTVSVGGEKTFLHHIPSGILHPGRLCLLGNGMVVDPDRFLGEVETLETAGYDVEGRLFLSDRAHLIFPHHLDLDQGFETDQANRIGTTKRGVGQAYQAKSIRVGVRGADLGDAEELNRRLGLALRMHEAWRGMIPSLEPVSLDDLLETAASFRERLAPYLDDTTERLHAALDQGKKVLFEGSQGALLDVDHGTYPFVTSSNTVVGAACAGAGVGPAQIDGAIGVFKAYGTRVGEGPMPTEELGEVGEKMRQAGHEFGTTTGRPRRCGWFDAVAGRYATRINGLTVGALTKLDVLDGFAELQIAVAYDTPGGRLQRFPAALCDLKAAQPVYETVPGWESDTSSCRHWSDLPRRARDFVERLEALLGVRFALVSVGADRDQTIIRDPAVLDGLFA